MAERSTPTSLWYRFLTIEAKDGDVSVDAWALRWSALPALLWGAVLIRLQASGSLEVGVPMIGVPVLVATGASYLVARSRRRLSPWMEGCCARWSVVGLLLGAEVAWWGSTDPSALRLRALGWWLAPLLALPLMPWLAQRAARAKALRTKVWIRTPLSCLVMAALYWLLQLDHWAARMAASGEWLALSCGLASMAGLPLLHVWVLVADRTRKPPRVGDWVPAILAWAALTLAALELGTP